MDVRDVEANRYLDDNGILLRVSSGVTLDLEGNPVATEGDRDGPKRDFEGLLTFRIMAQDVAALEALLLLPDLLPELRGLACSVKIQPQLLVP